MWFYPTPRHLELPTAELPPSVLPLMRDGVDGAAVSSSPLAAARRQRGDLQRVLDSGRPSRAVTVRASETPWCAWTSTPTVRRVAGVNVTLASNAAGRAGPRRDFLFASPAAAGPRRDFLFTAAGRGRLAAGLQHCVLPPLAYTHLTLPTTLPV